MLDYNSTWSQESVTFWDYILLPFFLSFIYLYARSLKNKNVLIQPEYSYFVSGLFFKILGGLGVCLIYRYYYGWGDTLDYYYGTIDLGELLFKKTELFFSVFSGDLSWDNYFSFINTHSWSHIWRDPDSYSVVRFSVFLSYLGLRTYFGITILLASLSYIGIWKLFTLFFKEFKEIKKQIAFALLFVPSVAFWGSGLLKDTYTFSATCWIVYCFFKVFIDKEKILSNIIIIIIMIYILLSIRPFMLYISLVGILLMLSHTYITSIKGGLVRALIILVILVVFWGGGLYFILYIGQNTKSNYKLDNLLEKAAITQQDLSREYYGENSFNIGAFEPTISGILSKAPVAINAGLFYPYIWKANNPVMLIAGMENLILLLLSLYVLLLIIIAIFKVGPKYMLKTLFDHPLIIFSLSYAIPFAFMVGLTTANYGALVRYKIPLIPFYLASLFIIIHKFNRSFAADNKNQKDIIVR